MEVFSYCTPIDFNCVLASYLLAKGTFDLHMPMLSLLAGLGVWKDQLALVPAVG